MNHESPTKLTTAAKMMIEEGQMAESSAFRTPPHTIAQVHAPAVPKSSDI